MNDPVTAYRIFPLGDNAITIDFGNCIDSAINNEVIARFNELSNHPIPGMIEAVPAYSSLTVYYDLLKIKRKAGTGSAYEWIRSQMEERLMLPVQRDRIAGVSLIKIPVCYDDEYAPDLHHIALTKNISIEEIVQTHTANHYKVYMLGFLPGFPYMGEVDEKIAIARKPQPANVVAGSVGIAGKQTGIYPMDSPGGWHIVGRTPLRLFDKEGAGSTLLKAGDTVQFYSISKDEFASY